MIFFKKKYSLGTVPACFNPTVNAAFINKPQT